VPLFPASSENDPALIEGTTVPSPVIAEAVSLKVVSSPQS